MDIIRTITPVITQKFKPDAFLEVMFDPYDIALRTNGHGQAILVIIGKKNSNGNLHGAQYARRFEFDSNDTLIADNWEYIGAVVLQMR